MFLIIDGSSLLTSSYYGNLPKEVLMAKTEEEKKANYNKILHSKNGKYTNAIYTMSKSLVKMLKEQKPDYIAVVFDKSRNTFRRFMYPGYKAQRGETPEPLKEQFVAMEDILKASGFMVLYSDNYEADDYAGSIMDKFAGKEPIRLLTKDHDYMQLVNDSLDVKLWLLLNSKESLQKAIAACGDSQESLNKPDRSYELGEKEVENLEGVLPYQIPEIKGICGDTSDNIPGIRGVSDKTAVPLLKKYRTLDTIYQEIQNRDEKELAAEWKGLGIKRNPIKQFKEGKEIGRLSVNLATIRRNIPVPESIEDYAVAKLDMGVFARKLADSDITSIKI